MRTAFSRFTLSSWLTAAVVATALAAVGGTVLLVEQFAQRHAEANANTTLRLVASHLREALDRGMQQHFEEIASLAALSPLHEGRSSQDVRVILDQIKRSFPEFAWIGLTDTEGRVYAATGRLLEGANVAARPWYAGAQAGPYVGDVHAALLLEKLLPAQQEPWRFVDIAAPVVGPDGQKIGILASHLSWDWARGVHAALLDPDRQAQGVEVLVVGRDGTVLIGPKSLEGQPLPTAFRAPSAGASAPALRRSTTTDGVDYFTASATTDGAGRYPGLGWSVVVRQPAALAIADYQTLRNEILAVGGLVSVLACVAAALVARRLSSPLRRMCRALEEGDVDIDPQHVGRYREAQQLAQAFRDLFARQRAHADELQRLNTSLEARVEERTAHLQQAQSMLRGVTDNLPVLISYIDRDLCLQFCNATYQRWFGIDPVAHVGRPMAEVVGDERWKPRAPFVEKALASGETLSFGSQASVLGQLRDLETTYVAHRSAAGEVLGLYAMSTDVTALKEGERAMAQLARVDPLTGLPNRYQLMEQIPKALARGRRARSAVALLFIDVDHFKQVNDTLGHPAGDAVLTQFAQRLKGCVRETDIVARLAGDEFVVVLEGLRDSSEAELVAQKLVAAVAQPMKWQGASVRIGGSVGVAFEPACAATADELLARADQALYDAKRAGRSGYRIKTPAAASV